MRERGRQLGCDAALAPHPCVQPPHMRPHPHACNRPTCAQANGVTNVFVARMSSGEHSEEEF